MGYALKLNGVEYSDVDRIQIQLSDGSGITEFWEMKTMQTMRTTQIPIYKNPYITATPYVYSLGFVNAVTCVLEGVSGFSCDGNSVLKDARINNLILPNASGAVSSRYLFQSHFTVFDIGGNVSSISSHGLRMPSGSHLILRGQTSVPTLAESFTINSGTTVYVPSAIIESIRADEAWATLIENGVVVEPLEGSTYENEGWYLA